MNPNDHQAARGSAPGATPTAPAPVSAVPSPNAAPSAPSPAAPTSASRPAAEASPVAPLRGIGQAPAAVADRLSKRYGDGPSAVVALHEVSLAVGAGEFLAIMGPSGSGKSTLMQTMAGLDVATSGRVLIGQSEITHMDDDELTRLRRDRIGFVFQSFNLLPTLDVRENVLLPFLLAGHAPTGDEAAWADRLIADLGLAERARHRPAQLSGGQQQRVAIARALVTHPVIVFADEPTGNLDSRSSREVLDLLQRMSRDAGQSIVMVTHDAVAAARADRVVVLADGRIVRAIGRAPAAEISRIMLALEAQA